MLLIMFVLRLRLRCRDLLRMDGLLYGVVAMNKITVVGVFYIAWLGVALKLYVKFSLRWWIFNKIELGIHNAIS